MSRSRRWMRAVAVAGLTSFTMAYVAPIAMAANEASKQRPPLEALAVPSFSFPGFKKPGKQAAKRVAKAAAPAAPSSGQQAPAQAAQPPAQTAPASSTPTGGNASARHPPRATQVPSGPAPPPAKPAPEGSPGRGGTAPAGPPAGAPRAPGGPAPAVVDNSYSVAPPQSSSTSSQKDPNAGAPSYEDSIGAAPPDPSDAD